MNKNLAVNRTTSFELVGALNTLVAFASGPVTLDDKDNTGRFDGEWVGSVESPRAKKWWLWSGRCQVTDFTTVAPQKPEFGVQGIRE